MKVKVTCLLVSIVLLFSLLSVTVFASTSPVIVTGSKRYFTVDGKQYYNYGTMQYQPTNPDISGGAFVGSSVASPAGHLGAKGDIYKQNSNGTYSIVASSKWMYSTVEVLNWGNYMATYRNPGNGYYKFIGTTGVYKDGPYITYNTYDTPIIQVY